MGSSMPRKTFTPVGVFSNFTGGIDSMRPRTGTAVSLYRIPFAVVMSTLRSTTKSATFLGRIGCRAGAAIGPDIAAGAAGIGVLRGGPLRDSAQGSQVRVLAKHDRSMQHVAFTGQFGLSELDVDLLAAVGQKYSSISVK